MPTLEDLSQEQRDELALLARDLSDSPETRKDFLSLVRKKRPNQPMPELDIDERLTRAEAAQAEKIAALEAKLSDKDMRSELERRRAKLITDGKAANQEDIEAIEKVMLDKGIQSHDTAADYWDWMKGSAKPTPPSYNTQFIDNTARDTLKDYWKNPISAARNEAAKALQDLRKNPKLAG